MPAVRKKKIKVIITASSPEMYQMKLNVVSLMKYFRSVLREKTGFNLPLNRHEYQVLGAALKTSVVDLFILNDLEAEDMVEFVDWIFEKKPQEKWSLNFLKFFVKDWFLHRSVRRKQGETRKPRMDRSEEQQYLRYLGEGYFDNDLTKYQYWTGIKWRLKNLSPARLGEIDRRQKRMYSSETLERLTSWKEELGKSSFDPTRQFYLELSASRSKSVRATLEEFGRPEVFKKFIEGELDVVPEHPALDKKL